MFQIAHVEPLKKIYRKMLFTLKSLFNVLELRHDTMQKHVAAAIKSRYVSCVLTDSKVNVLEAEDLGSIHI